jgi:hypothetical protein
VGCIFSPLRPGALATYVNGKPLLFSKTTTRHSSDTPGERVPLLATEARSGAPGFVVRYGSTEVLRFAQDDSAICGLVFVARRMLCGAGVGEGFQGVGKGGEHQEDGFDFGDLEYF